MTVFVRRDKGFALVAILGVLALLAVLAMSLVSATSLERNLGGNFVLYTRALLAAESGISAAIARVNDLSAGPMTEEELERLGQYDAEELAFARDIEIGGRPERVSGLLDVRVMDPVFTLNWLHVSESSGRLNLNDSNVACPVPADHPMAGIGRLEGIVAALCDAMQFGVAGNKIAEALFRSPTAGRISHAGDQFPDEGAVIAVLRETGLNEEEIARFFRQVTLTGWQDEDALQPAPVLEPGTRVDAWLEFQTRDFTLTPRSPVNLNSASPELLTALIQPLEGLYLEEGPAETQSIEHYGWWSTGLGSPDPRVNNMGTVRATEPFSPEQAARLANAMADRVHGRMNADVRAHVESAVEPDPFETWEEFRVFLEKGLVDAADRDIFRGKQVDADRDRPQSPGFSDPHIADDPEDPENQYFTRGISAQFCDFQWYAAADDKQGAWWRRYYAQAQRDMVFANFNPNSLLNDWNPNANTHLMVDKAQLRVQTAEGCFASTGVFRIHSRAAVRRGGDTLAEAEIESCVRPFVVHRLTSQAEFMAGLDAIAEVPRYFSVAAPREGGLFGPWQTQDACYIGTASYGLQSYPEPMLWEDPATLRVPPSRYDGNLQLATLGLHRHVQWNLGQDFDGFDRLGNCVEPLTLASWKPEFSNASDQYHRDGVNRPHAGPLTGAWDADEQTPGVVYPDGAYSEKGRTLAYRLGNFSYGSGLSGTMGFWFKPNFHMGISTRIRKLVAGPSKPGRYARQTVFSMYFLSNPGNHCADGFTRGVAAPPVNTFDADSAYGNVYRNFWAPARCLAMGTAWNTGDVNGYYDEEVEWDEYTGEPTRWERISNFRSFRRAQFLSPTVAHDAPSAHLDTALPAALQYHVAGRHWNHVVFGWTMEYENNWGSGLMYLNSKVFPYPPDRMGRTAFYHPQSGMPQVDLSAAWVRFGEFAPGSSANNGAESPYYADSTYDHLWGAAGSSGVWEIPFRTGRYIYRQVTNTGGVAPYIARYTSPRIPLQARLGLSPRTELEFRSVAWTLYRPRHNRAYTPNTVRVTDDRILDNVTGIAVNPNDLPDPVIREWATDTGVSDTAKEFWDPVSVDIQTPARQWLYQQTVAGGAGKLFTYAGGSVMSDADGAAPRYTSADAFQFCLHFHLAANQHVFESPVLDDVTLTFRLTQPEILRWVVKR